jgi:hypothetical protein
MHLDWISTYRVPDVAAAAIWDTLQSLVRRDGDNADMNHSTVTLTYGRIMAFVKRHHLDVVQVINMCPCGECIYHDFQDPDLRILFRYSGSGRQECAHCGETRYVPGTTTARKVLYYISPEIWMRDLYQRRDIAAALYNDRDPSTTPVGSIHRSQGYYDKVTNNPDMNCDSRHAAVIGMADGAPFFKDRNAGSGWFFMLRHTGLPAALQLDPTLAHMTIFISNYHLEEEEGVTKRMKR